jgi:protein-S-isoprenylcysteine O-methyltransferase Ste14
MPFQSIIIIGSFSFLGLAVLIIGSPSGNKSKSVLGKPTIEAFNFYSAKTAIFINWAMFMLKAIVPDFGYITVIPLISWIAVGILIAGTLVMIAAIHGLGATLKVGLPEEDTELRTDGIYSFSRNPIYLGVFIIILASCLYFPDLINIAAGIYAVFMHHKIIKGEEKFLETRFGESWKNYRLRVRRYL